MLAKSYKAKEAVDAVELEEDIRVVLNALANVDDSVQLVSWNRMHCRLMKNLNRKILC